MVSWHSFLSLCLKTANCRQLTLLYESHGCTIPGQNLDGMVLKHLQWWLQPLLMEVIWLTKGLCKSMSIVDSHLKVIPSLRTLPTGSFSCLDSQGLGSIWTGPFTLKFLSVAPLIKWAYTFSKGFTLRLVRVIVIWWITTSVSTGVFPVFLKAMATAQLPDQLVPGWEWTVVREEQEWEGQSCIAAATMSSSDHLFFKRCLGLDCPIN